MRVTYDPQTFLRQRTGGISRLFTDLIRTFRDNPEYGVTPELPFKWVYNRYAAQDLPHMGLTQTPEWLPREFLYATWILRGLPSINKTDIVHHTYYSPRFLDKLQNTARVCTVYDMIPELFRGTDLFTGSHLRKQDYVMGSDLVICISESTRLDMLSIYGDVPGQVTVVPCGVGHEFRPGLERLPGLPNEYLLYVGGRRGYKDFKLLPASMAHLLRFGCEIPVVVVGSPFSREERAQLAKLRVGQLFSSMNLNDRELQAAYSNCSALIHTSRYEGFGMTPLEAMASGAPVVVAQSSSMPEVCGDVALYFQPGEVDDLAEAILRVLTDTRVRSELKLKGPERAAKFTVEGMAAETARLYKELVGE